MTVNATGRGGRVYYASTSRRLLDGVASLLLRFGIPTRLRTVTPGQHRPQYTLDVSGRDDQLRFLREIGVHGASGRGLRSPRTSARRDRSQYQRGHRPARDLGASS